MSITIKELQEAREYSSRLHRPWKARSMTNDTIARGEWTTIWDDAAAEISDPLVENIYIEALEDKAMAASTINPVIVVPPTPGTRLDRAERSSEKKRLVHLSYMERSDFDRLHTAWYYDWFHHGAAYSATWFSKFTKEGRELLPEEVFPWYMRLDPRQAFPLSHNNQHVLTSIIFRRMRTYEALRQEYGESHPALQALNAFRSAKRRNPDTPVEELWYFDTADWAVAFADPGSTMHPFGRTKFGVPQESSDGGMFMEWAFPPEKHQLETCPVAEAKRTTFDGEYRGALDAVIPNLRVAHNLMARILDDAADQVYAPVILDNVENWEEFGPNAVLRGTGEGPAAGQYLRPPGNFEATTKVQEKKAEARLQARHPEQRIGEAGASIISGKGVESLMGAFNSELATSQKDMQHMLKEIHMRTANADEVWGAGDKGVTGMDKGVSFIERYNPASLFQGDYRLRVTYGGNLGLSQNAAILNAATVRNMQGMSRRTFMEFTGMIDNPLQEEREIGLDSVSDLMVALLAQIAQTGDISALQSYAALIDGDRDTHRSAIFKVFREMQASQPPSGGGSPAGPGGAGDPGAAVQAARSQASGGIPGNAEGQPAGGVDALRSALGPGVTRALSETAPGGTAA